MFAGKMFPERRKSQIYVQKLEEEILIYDLDRNEAHCLNGTAAQVWDLCDGERSVFDIAAIVAPALEAEHAESLVWTALDQFTERHLLEEMQKDEAPSPTLMMTRRQTVSRLALAFGLAIPVVESIVSPAAAVAQSLTGCSGSTDGQGSTPCSAPV